MKKFLIFLIALLLLSCHRDGDNKKLEIQVDTLGISSIDTNKFDEVRYTTTKRFTSSGLYNLHCKLCHGNDGTGDGVIARYHQEEYCPYDLSKVEKPDQQVYYVILNGTEHMPDASKPVANHILTDDDIWMVVVYIKKFRE